jgi:hypothetical protein
MHARTDFFDREERAMRKLICVAVLLLMTVGPGATAFLTPTDTINALYGNYEIGPNSGKNGLTDQAAKQIFDKSLFALYERAVKSGAMDFDFFVQGQDFSLVKPIEIDSVSTAGTKAKVSATLTQSGLNRAGKPTIRQNHFIFALVNNGHSWKLDDAFCEGESFTDELAATIKEGNK